MTLAQTVKKKTDLKYEVIFRFLFGLDIADYSILRAMLILSLLALTDGEDEANFHFNLYCGDALSFNFQNESEIVAKNNGFDVIVGNPPYVCSRNLDDQTMTLLKKWIVTFSGHPDLYIPFFQIGYENLAENGFLGYISVNTFFKSLYGRALRKYFSDNLVKLRIINLAAYLHHISYSLSREIQFALCPFRSLLIRV